MRLLVASRGHVVADSLRAMMGTAIGAPDGVQTTSTAKLGSSLASYRPDLLVIDDTSLGSITALALCRETRRVDQVLPILYVSNRSAPPDEVLALDAGADSFLTYPCVAELAQARTRALMRRQEPRELDVLRYEDVELNTVGRLARRGERQVPLTPTEYALLHLFLRNPERVLTRDLLIEKVWGYDYSGNYGVLDVYVCYLRGKLEANGEARLIQTIRGTGYVLRPTPELAYQRSVASEVPRRRPAGQPPRLTARVGRGGLADRQTDP